MKGIIKFYKFHGAYGYILAKDNNEYFLHISRVVKGQDKLLHGARVDFTPQETKKGLQAIDVIVK